MKNVLVIGSGISGMSCAIHCAQKGMHVTLVSPFPSERSQSVMAAGGINAVLSENQEDDSIEIHIEDTLKGGAYIAGKKAVEGLCTDAGPIVKYLEGIGTVFSIDADGKPKYRAFGGQSRKRTYYCGASTGKQIVTALNMEVRRLEAAGQVERQLGTCFHSALIKDGVCYGALLFRETTGNLDAVYADAVVMATGGQNTIFGKTTGSTQCDGYAAGRLFEQGVVLKNLEFIQYHPTTLETSQKRMLISEAVRGEGGRLFYEENGKRVYFMEDKYGPGGNLQTRDVVSREIYATHKDVYLDISFLDAAVINERLPEVRDLCRKYRGIDITREPIPVAPSVHFFMGGIAVHNDHSTSVSNLYAVGECASIYHGANRLGGNSLLAAVHGGRVAAQAIDKLEAGGAHPSFEEFITKQQEKLAAVKEAQSTFAYANILNMLAHTMQEDLGIVRDEASLRNGLQQIDYYLSVADRIRYDSSVLAYFNYSLPGILTLARGVLTCALNREESRGAHYRSDCPDTDESFAHATLISYDGGRYRTWLDTEGEYES